MDLKSALAAGDKIIGYLTWYDCRNATITPGQLKLLFNKHNLDEKFLPDGIKPKHAFQKACRKAMNIGTSDTRRSITKLIVDGMNKIVYGVVDLDVNETQESIDPDFSDRIWLDKDNLSVGFDKGHELSKKIKDLYNQLCGEYVTRDISRMIVNTLDKLCSVSLRDGGVIYFVPYQFNAEMQALQSVVNEVGDCNMRLFAIGNGQGNVNGIHSAAKSQINDKVSNLKSKINELRQSIDDGAIKGKIVDNGVEVRINKFKELKERCAIIADALKIKAESLEGELEEVGKLLKAKLMEA